MLVGGDELMRWLKTNLLTRHIPIIVATPLLVGTAVDRAVAAGAADVIQKPFNFDALSTTLQRHLPVTSGV
jgi:CheY-like chemotaxis protein